MLVRRIARPMVSGIFIAGGLDAARHPDGKVEAAENINAGKIASSLHLSSTEQLVRLNGVAQLVGGLAFATGRLPRLASFGLAASLAPTTLAGHRFWEQDDAGAKKMQQLHFFKNLSIVGGLLLASVDTEGKESVARKVSRTTKTANSKAQKKANKRARKLKSAVPSS